MILGKEIIVQFFGQMGKVFFFLLNLDFSSNLEYFRLIGNFPANWEKLGSRNRTRVSFRKSPLLM